VKPLFKRYWMLVSGCWTLKKEAIPGLIITSAILSGVALSLSLSLSFSLTETRDHRVLRFFSAPSVSPDFIGVRDITAQIILKPAIPIYPVLLRRINIQHPVSSISVSEKSSPLHPTSFKELKCYNFRSH